MSYSILRYLCICTDRRQLRSMQVCMASSVARGLWLMGCRQIIASVLGGQRFSSESNASMCFCMATGCFISLARAMQSGRTR